MSVQHGVNEYAAKTTRFIIVGGGMSGILAAVKLKAAGFNSFTILEKASEIGGVWRDNTYPGLRCDVPAHMFVYSFEPHPEYSHRFAQGAEIRDYLRGVYGKHELASRVELNSEVVSATFENNAWTIRTAAGRSYEADVVITACGILHHPKYPDIPGRDSFQGDSFHTAHWRHDVPLKGKRVGVIGTGSTAVQVVPAVGQEAERLLVFQRTPHWIFPMPNKTYTEADKARLRGSAWYAHWLRQWYSFLFRWTFNRAVIGNRVLLFLLQTICEHNIRRKVKDPRLAAKLRPDYRAGCKRLVFAKGYYQALQRENTQLITDSISHITERAVVTADGTEHGLDVIVYATGFQAHNYMRPIEVVGKEGLRLNSVWEQGAFAHRSVAVPGFPNFFMVFGPYSPIGNYSAISVAEVQVNYILQLLRDNLATGVQTIEPRAEVTRKLLQDMRRAARKTVWLSGCNSWYLDAQGVAPMWPWTFERFAREMRRPKASEYLQSGENRPPTLCGFEGKPAFADRLKRTR